MVAYRPKAVAFLRALQRTSSAYSCRQGAARLTGERIIGKPVERRRCPRNGNEALFLDRCHWTKSLGRRRDGPLWDGFAARKPAATLMNRADRGGRSRGFVVAVRLSRLRARRISLRPPISGTHRE